MNLINMHLELDDMAGNCRQTENLKYDKLNILVSILFQVYS